MPQYFFDVRDRAAMRDDVGVELANIEAARIQAVRFAGALLAEDPTKFLGGDEWRIEVRQPDGLILFTVAFVATDAPCATRTAFRATAAS